MATLSIKPDSDNFAAAFGLIIISLWSQCMEEKYVSIVHLYVPSFLTVFPSASAGASPRGPGQFYPCAQSH